MKYCDDSWKSLFTSSRKKLFVNKRWTFISFFLGRSLCSRRSLYYFVLVESLINDEGQNYYLSSSSGRWFYNVFFLPTTQNTAHESQSSVDEGRTKLTRVFLQIDQHDEHEDKVDHPSSWLTYFHHEIGSFHINTTAFTLYWSFIHFSLIYLIIDGDVSVILWHSTRFKLFYHTSSKVMVNDEVIFLFFDSLFDRSFTTIKYIYRYLVTQESRGILKLIILVLCVFSHRKTER